jgi:hypothetical protein
MIFPVVPLAYPPATRAEYVLKWNIHLLSKCDITILYTVLIFMFIYCRNLLL